MKNTTITDENKINITLGENLKKDFPIFSQKINGKNLIYLDNSATTQKPKVMIQSIVDFYEKTNANVHRGVHTLSEKATILYEKAHYSVANFINAKSTEVAFTSGTTQSLNIIAQLLCKKLEKGDEIIMSIMEHHSNFVPFQQLAKERGAVVKVIPLTEDYRLDMKAFKEMLSSKTKIVVITHVSNTLGTINPVKEICELAHSVGAYAVIDAAQSVPHIFVDVKEINCDFLAFSGHKLCGPTGVGVLYGREKLLLEKDPVYFGGGMIREVTIENSTWNDLPYKFEAGTPPIAQAIGLSSAITYISNIGMDKIEQYHVELMEYALSSFEKLKCVNLIGPKTIVDRIPIFSFVIDGVHPHDVAEILDKDGIAIRGGTHCTMPLMKSIGIQGTSRASLYFYNTKKDIDALMISIQKVQKLFSDDLPSLTCSNESKDTIESNQSREVNQ